MADPHRDHSVEHEPHLRGGDYKFDRSEAQARENLARGGEPSLDERVEHTVWDEPGLMPHMADQAAKSELTYANWLLLRMEQTSAAKSWLVTFLLVLISGPWAVFGTFLTGDGTLGMLAAVTVGPTLEELMKVAAALWVVERRPYLFQSRLQIAMCVGASGLAFAAIENLLYLHVYIPDPSPGLIAWRWTVCVGLHTGCSLVAGLGLMRIWKLTTERFQRPHLADAMPYLIAATVIHAAYNGFAVVLDSTGFQF